VVGNEQGEILPKFLNAKWVMIESGKAFGRQITITTSDEQRDRCKYSIVLVVSSNHVIVVIAIVVESIVC